MKSLYSTLGELAAAWRPLPGGDGAYAAAVSPTLTPAASGTRLSGSRILCSARNVATPVAMVLIAADSRIKGQESSAISNGGAVDVARRMHRDARYAFTTVAAADLTELEPHLREQQPRVLFIEESLLYEVNDATVRYLHRRNPGVYWVLAWTGQSVGGFRGALRSRARGAIEVHASAEHIGLALATVLAGDLWFPRHILHAMYFSVLSTWHIEASLLQIKSGDFEDRRAAFLGLTPREAQTLALMREGLSNKQIGQRLGVSVSTVKKHLEHTFKKQGLCNRRQTMP